jgi:hypothetical protein
MLSGQSKLHSENKATRTAAKMLYKYAVLRIRDVYP